MKKRLQGKKLQKNLVKLLRKMEKLDGSLQITLERPKESSLVFYDSQDCNVFSQDERIVYGALHLRPCKVIPILYDLPNNKKLADELTHDASLLKGKYGSITEVNQKIENIPNLSSLCFPSLYDTLHKPLLEHLADKHKVEEKDVYIAHGDQPWYVVDSVVADLKRWKVEMPELYKEALDFLKNNEVAFLYNDLIATPTGVYVYESDFALDESVFMEYFDKENYLDSRRLLLKIADVKLKLLK